MADYGSNLIVNPSAIQPLVEGWASNNVTVIDEGLGTLYYRIGALGYMQQNILTTIFGTSTNTVKLSIRTRFINSGIPIYTDILLFMQLSVTSTIKATETEAETNETVLYTLPCQTMISTGDSGWFLFEGEFDVTQTNINAVILNVYTVQTDVVIDIDSIAVAQAKTASPENQIRDDAAAYTDINLEKHLEDMDNSHLSDEQKAGLTGKTPRLKTIKLGLESNIHSANSKLYDGNVPLVSVDITRKSKPITTPLYWQEVLVETVQNVTCTSIAVEKSADKIGKVYVAYITAGTLVVRSAVFGYPISEMVWTTETQIAGCVSCAVEFNGSFKRIKTSIEFITETIPWLFYTTVAGELIARKLNDDFTLLSATNVSIIDAVKGIASLRSDIDQGIIVFYIISGSVYYRQYINGVWQGQQQVTIAPANAVSIRVERLFDYRICLQITDASGALFETFTKMEASGWNSTEYIDAVIAQSTVTRPVVYYNFPVDISIIASIQQSTKTLYALSPVILMAVNIDDGYGNYGRVVHVLWDEHVYEEVVNISQFKIVDANNIGWSGQSVTKTGKILLITFADFNNAVNPVSVTYTKGTLMGDVVLVDSCLKTFDALGLVPTELPIPELIAVENIDAKQIVVTFDMPVTSSNWTLAKTGFSVSSNEYDMLTGGVLLPKEYTIDSVVPLSTIITTTETVDDTTFIDTVISNTQITLDQET